VYQGGPLRRVLLQATAQGHQGSGQAFEPWPDSASRVVESKAVPFEGRRPVAAAVVVFEDCRAGPPDSNEQNPEGCQRHRRQQQDQHRPLAVAAGPANRESSEFNYVSAKGARD